MLKTMCIQRTIERLVASFMINLCSIYRQYRVIYSGLGRLQSIRAKSCSRAAKNCCHLPLAPPRIPRKMFDSVD